MAGPPDAAPAILVAGAGAIGSFLAARLSNAGYDAALLTQGRRLEDLAAEGVLLAEHGKVSRVAVPVTGAVMARDPAQWIVLCTKTLDIPAVLDAVSLAVGPATTFVTTQNGVDTPGRVAACYPGAAILAARIHGFFELDSRTVRHVGVTPSIVLGEVREAGTGAEKALAFCDILSGAGISARRSGDIEAELWQKFVLASALGGVGAATGLPAGPMLRDPAAWALLAEAVSEVCALAERRGVRLAPDTARRTLDFVARFPDDARTSMMRDLEAGRPSEYASLTGAVLDMAQQAGLAVPAFETIEARLKARGLI